MTKRTIPVLVLLLVVTALLLIALIFIRFSYNTENNQAITGYDLVLEEVTTNEITYDEEPARKKVPTLRTEYQSIDYNNNDRDQNDSGGDDEDVIECNRASQCGEDFYQAAFCLSGNVYRYKTEFSCSSGSCEKDKKKEIVDHCLLGCSNGQCIRPTC